MSSGYPDYEGGKQRVYSVADWAALFGVDKTFRATGVGQVYAGTATGNYVVPAGKTLYIVQASVEIHADAAANAELNQMTSFWAGDATAGSYPLFAGGNGGVVVPLVEPLIIPAGHIFLYHADVWANHACTLNLTISGYEV